MIKTGMIGLLLMSLLVTSCSSVQDEQKENEKPMNNLTEQEIADGWILLFDGETTSGWRNYKKHDINQKWKAIDGTLTLTGKGGGDIVTTHKFDNFELNLDWKISKGGNNGIFYHVVEESQKPMWESGPEYQILDNDHQPRAIEDNERAGALYGLYAPSGDYTRPVGEFNETRLIVLNGKVEHWLNGHKVVEYELNSEDWKKRVAASKFSSKLMFGKAGIGYIALQDHGNESWFRNIKIKRLP